MDEIIVDLYDGMSGRQTYTFEHKKYLLVEEEYNMVHLYDTKSVRTLVASYNTDEVKKISWRS